MRPLLKVLTIIFFIIGFFIPVVWVLAVIFAVSAIASASDSLKMSAGEQTSGMMAGKEDENAVSQKSKSCPACLGTVSCYAAKCHFCGEILEVSPD